MTPEQIQQLTSSSPATAIWTLVAMGLFWFLKDGVQYWFERKRAADKSADKLPEIATALSKQAEALERQAVATERLSVTLVGIEKTIADSQGALLSHMNQHHLTVVSRLDDHSTREETLASMTLESARDAAKEAQKANEVATAALKLVKNE